MALLRALLEAAQGRITRIQCRDDFSLAPMTGRRGPIGHRRPGPGSMPPGAILAAASRRPGARRNDRRSASSTSSSTACAVRTSPSDLGRPDQTGPGHSGRPGHRAGPGRSLAAGWRICSGTQSARIEQTQMTDEIVVFLGPTLGHDDARALLPNARFLPPARQGDVYRAVRAHDPKKIGLVDGVFLNVPAVWHREILWALEQGVEVFGAASMGALRAAELDDFGMMASARSTKPFVLGAIRPLTKPSRTTTRLPSRMPQRNSAAWRSRTRWSISAKPSRSPRLRECSIAASATGSPPK